MKQILSALYYMHSSGIAHRDLKPENFLFKEKLPSSGTAGGLPISKNSIKVIDFGIAGRFHHKASEQDQYVPCLRTMAGTAYYVAPEVLTAKYSEKCDVWSSGVILYILLSGTPPFGGHDDNEIMAAVKKGVIDYNIEELQKISKDAKNLIKQMCQMDPKKEALCGPVIEQHLGATEICVKAGRTALGRVFEETQGFQFGEPIQESGPQHYCAQNGGLSNCQTT